MRSVSLLFSAFLCAVGLASLALTLYLWFGDWPQQTRDVVEALRSEAENAERGPDPTLGSVFAREPRSLGGTWQAVIDPFDAGTVLAAAPRALRPEAPADLGEFSFENGLTLEVPGDWNTQDPRLVFYQGAVWYKRTFSHDPSPNRRTFLHFGAANYRAAVYLNGRLLGVHEGGFTPFNFEVGDALKTGENLLVVQVDNRREAGDIPTPTTDWHNYGGLTREVQLVEVPGTYVRAFQVSLAASGDAIEGWAEVAGSDPKSEVTWSVPELGIEISATPDADGRAEFSVPAEPERWSPDSPRLYSVEVRAGTDRVSEDVGFRTVETRGTEILLNGEPIFLRGISLHEEAPHGEGRAWSPGHARTLLGWAADLGCNFVRLAHYPHSEHMAREADRLGLLVWEEIPVYWAVAFAEERTLERARRQLSEVIERDANRASVILWSVANETPMTETRLSFLSELVSHVRSEDSTRLVTAALLTGREALQPFFLEYYLPALIGVRRPEWVLDVEDPLGDLIDVASVNEYFGWYYSGAVGLVWPFGSARARTLMLENMDRIRIRTGLDKPLVISEMGAGAKAGLHAPEEDLHAYSEEFQALVYRHQLAMLEKQEDLAGMSPWVLKDFRAPLRLYQGVQDHWNRKGLVSDEGDRKLAFGVLRDYYRGLSAAEPAQDGPREDEAG